MDSTKPMFPAAVQLAVITENKKHIDFMQTAKDIQQWNLNRHVVRASVGGNSQEYIMLMGHIDGVVFGQTFSRKQNERK